MTQNLVVAAMLFFTLKCIGYLRGFESTGWLVTVLIQNIFDVQGFLALIVLFLFGFAIALRALWGTEYEETDDDKYDDDEKTREYLVSARALSVNSAPAQTATQTAHTHVSTPMPVSLPHLVPRPLRRVRARA